MVESTAGANTTDMVGHHYCRHYNHTHMFVLSRVLQEGEKGEKRTQEKRRVARSLPRVQHIRETEKRLL